MRTRWLVAGVLAAVCSVALAACNDGDATPTGTSSTQSPTATGASSSSTPTPTKSLTPEQQDLQDAEQSIVNYWKVLDEAASNPKSDLNALATVARAQALAQWQSTLFGLSLQGLGAAWQRRASVTRWPAKKAGKPSRLPPASMSQRRRRRHVRQVGCGAEPSATAAVLRTSREGPPRLLRDGRHF